MQDRRMIFPVSVSYSEPTPRFPNAMRLRKNYEKIYQKDVIEKEPPSISGEI